MKRKIVEIDREKCNGCGLCANACHEGAIEMVDGKAQLVKDDYCDGMGDCLPACPTGAITITEREAAAYDEKAVAQRKAAAPSPGMHACPGSMARMLKRDGNVKPNAIIDPGKAYGQQVSSLGQWPVQIKLVPEKAPYFQGAKLLIAADCTAYAYASFHRDMMRRRITIIGCPKLDEGDYTVKLTSILAQNDIKELLIVRMEVPCCGGLERAATNALKESGKFIPWRVITVAIDGHIID